MNKKIRIRKPNQAHETQLIIDPNFFTDLAPLPRKDEEEDFLKHICALFVMQENPAFFTRHYFYRILKHTLVDEDTYTLICTDKIGVNSGFTLNIRQTAENYDIQISEISDNEIENDRVLKNLIRLCQSYETDVQKRSVRAFLNGNIVPISVAQPTINPYRYNAKRAARIFDLQNAEVQKISVALKKRKDRLLQLKMSVQQEMACIMPLRASNTSQALLTFIATEIEKTAVEQRFSDIQTIISGEEKRLKKEVEDTPLMEIVNNGFRDDEKYTHEPIMETLKARYRDYEVYDSEVRSIKIGLAQTIFLAASKYYEILKARVRKLTEENDRHELMKSSRQLFNNLYVAVGISMNEKGQLITEIEETFSRLSFATIQMHVRDLLKKCDTASVGSSTSHKLLIEGLTQFEVACRAQYLQKWENEQRQPSGYGLHFDWVTKTPLFDFQDSVWTLVKTEFTWSAGVYQFEEEIKQQCEPILAVVKGAMEEGGRPGLIKTLLGRVENVDEANEQLAKADSLAQALHDQILLSLKAIESHKAFLAVKQQAHDVVTLAESKVIAIQQGLGNITILNTNPPSQDFAIANKEYKDIVTNLNWIKKQANEIVGDSETCMQTINRLMTEAQNANPTEIPGLLESMQTIATHISKNQEIITLYESAIQASNKILRTIRASIEMQANAEEYPATLLNKLGHENINHNNAIVFAHKIMTTNYTSLSRYIGDASEAQKELASALQPKILNPTHVKELTQTLNSINRNLETANEHLTQQLRVFKHLYFEDIEKCEQLFRVVSDLAFWHRQVKWKKLGGGKPVRLSENNTLLVPEGIKALLDVFESFPHFRDNPNDAEQLLAAAKHIVELSIDRANHGIFSYGLFKIRRNATQDFYRYFRDGHLNLWVSLNLPQHDQSSRVEHRLAM